MNSYLTISDPCHESWDKMLPAGKGRFCHSCQKQVLDLRGSTYDEIMTEYKSSAGDMCGRIDGRELSKVYVDQRLRQLRAEQVRNFFLAVLLSFGVSLFSVTKASAVNVLKQMRTAVTQAAADSLEISGTVRDNENKEPLPFANVMLYSGDTLLAGVITDLDGNYKIKVPAKNYSSLKLKTMYVGWIPKEITDIKIKDKLRLDIDVTLNPAVLGGLGETIYVDEQADDPHKLDGSGKTFRRKDFKKKPR